MSTNLPADLPPATPQVGQPAATGALAGANPRFSRPPTEDKPNWRRYIAAVLRYKWLIIAVTVVGTALGVVATRFIAPTYVAQATIWVESEGAQRGQADRGPIRSGQLLDTHAWIDLLKSYVVLDEVVRRLTLFVVPQTPADSTLFDGFALDEAFRPGDYVFTTAGREGVLATTEGLILDRQPVGDSLGRRLGFRWQPDSTQYWPERRVQFSITTPRDAALGLADDLAARIDRNGNFIRVQLSGSHPRRIADVVNATINRYVEVVANLKREKLTELTQILDEQLQYAQGNLRDAEIALEDFRVRTITLPSERATPVAPGLELTRDPVLNNFFDMQIGLEQMRRDREAVERVLAAVPDSGLSVDGLMIIGAVQNSSDLRTALEELTDKEAELRGLRLRYTDENPAVLRVEREVRELSAITVPRIARALVADLRTRESEMSSRIASGARDLERIPTRAIEEARLRRAVTIAEDLYSNLRARYEEARLAEASSIPDVRILDAAVVPRQPVSNTAPRVIAMGFIASLALGVLIALLLDRVDRRLRYPEQVTDDLGLPILGAVPHARSVNGNGRSATDTAEVLEALRGVRLAVSHAYGAAGPLLLTISSPGPGDGKSFVASNLALTFADAGHRTLLIDGDVRRGELHRVLGARRKPGLTDYLNGDLPRDHLIQATRYPSLFFIGGGTRRQSSPELLTSSNLSELLVSLRTSYGVILIDSPPLGAGVDPFVLATATSNLLLVLRTGVTDRELTEAKLDILDRMPIRILGSVLNDVRAGGPYRYYGYRYDVEGYEAVDEDEADARQLPEVGTQA